MLVVHVDHVNSTTEDHADHDQNAVTAPLVIDPHVTVTTEDHVNSMTADHADHDQNAVTVPLVTAMLEVHVDHLAASHLIPEVQDLAPTDHVSAAQNAPHVAPRTALVFLSA